MSNADNRLSELLAADMPPAADRAFALSVIERIERRRFWADVSELVPVVAGAAIVLWAAAPVIENLIEKTFATVNVPAFLAAVVLTLTGLAIIGSGRSGDALEL